MVGLREGRSFSVGKQLELERKKKRGKRKTKIEKALIHSSFEQAASCFGPARKWEESKVFQNRARRICVVVVGRRRKRLIGIWKKRVYLSRAGNCLLDLTPPRVPKSSGAVRAEATTCHLELTLARPRSRLLRLLLFISPPS